MSFIQVKKRRTERYTDTAKIDSESVMAYEKTNDGEIHIILIDGSEIIANEPSYVEFDKIMDPYPNENIVDKVKKWLALGATILVIILLVKMIFFD